MTALILCGLVCFILGALAASYAFGALARLGLRAAILENIRTSADSTRMLLMFSGPLPKQRLNLEVRPHPELVASMDEFFRLKDAFDKERPN